MIRLPHARDCAIFAADRGICPPCTCAAGVAPLPDDPIKLGGLETCKLFFIGLVHLLGWPQSSRRLEWGS